MRLRLLGCWQAGGGLCSHGLLNQSEVLEWSIELCLQAFCQAQDGCNANLLWTSS